MFCHSTTDMAWIEKNGEAFNRNKLANNVPGCLFSVFGARRWTCSIMTYFASLGEIVVCLGQTPMKLFPEAPINHNLFCSV